MHQSLTITKGRTAIVNSNNVKTIKTGNLRTISPSLPTPSINWNKQLNISLIVESHVSYFFIESRLVSSQKQQGKVYF